MQNTKDLSTIIMAMFGIPVSKNKSTRNRITEKIEEFIKAQDIITTTNTNEAMRPIFSKLEEKIPNVAEAVNTLVDALKTDEGLYLAYHANIAQGYLQAYESATFGTSIQEVANLGATNFLNLLMETTASNLEIEEYKSPISESLKKFGDYLDEYSRNEQLEKINSLEAMLSTCFAVLTYIYKPTPEAAKLTKFNRVNSREYMVDAFLQAFQNYNNDNPQFGGRSIISNLLKFDYTEKDLAEVKEFGTITANSRLSMAEDIINQALTLIRNTGLSYIKDDAGRMTLINYIPLEEYDKLQKNLFALYKDYQALPMSNQLPTPPTLPTNDEVCKWFTETIKTDCSASSAIYLFRGYLEQRALEHYKLYGKTDNKSDDEGKNGRCLKTSHAHASQTVDFLGFLDIQARDKYQYGTWGGMSLKVSPEALNQAYLQSVKDYSASIDILSRASGVFKAPGYSPNQAIAEKQLNMLLEEGYSNARSNAWKTDTGLRIMFYSTDRSHLSVSHPDRLPTFREIQWARDTFAPHNKQMAFVFPYDQAEKFGENGYYTITLFELFYMAAAKE